MRSFTLTFNPIHGEQEQIQFFYSADTWTPKFTRLTRQINPRFHSHHPDQPKFLVVEHSSGEGAIAATKDLLRSLTSE